MVHRVHALLALGALAYVENDQVLAAGGDAVVRVLNENAEKVRDLEGADMMTVARPFVVEGEAAAAQLLLMLGSDGDGLHDGHGNTPYWTPQY